MNQNNEIALYKWILQEFTIEGRIDFVDYLGPHLTKLIHPGDHVLDVCCGTGPFAFFLEEHGAKVTAIDFAPYMIQLAKKRALKQGSTVSFIQADVLTHDLGAEQFDVVVFLGNTVSDFSMIRFVQIGQKIAKALKQNGRFALHYIDGLYQFVQEKYPREDVQQEEPEKITRRFKEYLPEEAAYIELYTNEATGEAYEYTSYIYAPPYVRLAMDEIFALEQSIALSTRSFLDIYLKK
jgi:2-polyprenyl-3-methyl-5-hydroxy-6-metoxy-1,4-benzoquinol methylase